MTDQVLDDLVRGYLASAPAPSAAARTAALGRLEVLFGDVEERSVADGTLGLARSRGTAAPRQPWSTDRPQARTRRRLVLRVAAVGVVVCAIVAVVLSQGHTPSAAPAGLVAGPTGPCTGQPPGCGSPDSTAAALAAGTWSTFPTGPLSPRLGQVEVWTGHELIVWGGATPTSGLLQGGGLLGDGAAYNPATGTWRMLPSAPLSPRAGAAAAWTGTEMIVVGGNGYGVQYRDAAAYDPASNTWKLLPPFPLEARTQASAIWTGHQLVVIGGNGVTPNRFGVEYEDGAAYDPATNTWSVLPAIAGESHVLDVTPTWTGTELLVWVSWERIVPQVGNSGPGGNATSYVGTFVEQTGFALAAGATAWRELRSADVATNGGITAWTGTLVLEAGGSDVPPGASVPAGFGTGYRSYDPATESWAVVPGFSSDHWPAVWTGRAFVDTEASASCVACRADHVQRLSAYNPESSTWTVLPSAPNAIAGNYSEAVWTGRQLLVWGRPSEELTAGSASQRPSGPLPSPPPCPADATVPSMATGSYCGPLPTAGNGLGPGGECTGKETAPPCGSGVVPGRYYDYTLPGSCNGLIIFNGRKWVSELPPPTPVPDSDVWLSLSTSGTVGLISPKGATGFQPYTGQPLQTCSG